MCENEAVLISSASNLLYFTDIKNSNAYAVIVGKDKYYFTDENNLDYAKEKLTDYTVENLNDFYSFFKKNAIKKLGVENHLSHEICKTLNDNNINEFFEIDGMINRTRAIKSLSEIEFIKKAQEITDKVFSEVLSAIHEGMTEIELAGILESLLFVNGAEDLAFSSIVSFNENSCHPHAERTDNKLINGSIITLDFGAKYKNYCSDMTRTIFFGTPNSEYKTIYNHVLTAQQMVLSIAFSGMTGKECDTIARKYFSEYNLDKYFIHTLGHGVGIDIHEYPRLAQNSDVVMEKNMVVTIEPGLYLPKKFGVRIEDLIIFDKFGIINLTKSPKNMIIV